jgi:hypothetical protein
LTQRRSGLMRCFTTDMGSWTDGPRLEILYGDRKAPVGPYFVTNTKQVHAVDQTLECVTNSIERIKCTTEAHFTLSAQAKVMAMRPRAMDGLWLRSLFGRRSSSTFLVISSKIVVEDGLPEQGPQGPVLLRISPQGRCKYTPLPHPSQRNTDAYNSTLHLFNKTSALC